jgi:proteic killer suppression protein
MVRERAGNRCEYCGILQEQLSAAVFHVDHITPKQHGSSDRLPTLWSITLGVINEQCYAVRMIKSFKFSRKLSQDIQRVAARKLEQLQAATMLDTLRVPPGNRLEALTQDRQGQHSLRVNDQWRVCFVWRDGDAYDVEIVDYH